MLPAGLGAPVALGPSALPDDAVICSCHNVTKKAIAACATLAEVKKCTKAGTGCGSCVKVIGQLLPAAARQGAVRLLPATPAPSCTRSSAPAG